MEEAIRRLSSKGAHYTVERLLEEREALAVEEAVSAALHQSFNVIQRKPVLDRACPRHRYPAFHNGAK